MDSYKTVEFESHDEFVEKKSRFIGYVKPVKSAGEAVDFINEIKQKHWDATHNVYAYILRDGQAKRYSDDGEPQGTAGIPALDVLQKEGVTDCVVVITRYFGGIMLGAGGLVRAYSRAAKIALLSGNIITMSLCKVCSISCDYNYYGKLQPMLHRSGAVISDAIFEQNVTVEFTIPAENFEKLDSDIVDSSAGRFKCRIIDEKFSKI